MPDAPSQPVGDLHKATEKTVYVEWTPNHDNGQPITSYELQHIPCWMMRADGLTKKC